MASFVPVTLLGDNLGQRHRHLNSLVRQAKKSGPSFQDVETLPEESLVDHLFKIDLAIELKHVDYIIRNLKDDDMLYVSKALKSKWLIDHRDIINPKYLEDVLFPEMITPAVTKMKHWLYINLRDPAMCQEFYQHYKENTFEFALKFLSHCSHEFIVAEAPKILTKLSSHSLKVLCEKCPSVAKIYFDSLATDEDVKTRYLRQDRSYYNSIKCVLKSDADVFLDITEKYFNMNSFSRFSSLATDYILRCHKTRFTKKLELYVAYFLHIPTLAARLSVEECREVVLKLARASYLQQWFQYKVVEPLIKRLSPDKRAAFKKRVFVDKDVGDGEDKWPYEIPAPPTLSDIGLHIFDDQDFMSGIAPIFPPRAPGGGMLFGATAYTCAMQPQALNFINRLKVKTDLDRLFDEFRFIGFERALHELGQRLVATSSTDRRRDIFLVLVSKTGGRTDAVSALLRLTARHSNEPPHSRASVLRSLVKRAHVWRLPADVWQRLLDYGHGLGLDGTLPEAACREGLHAVVIRQLLAGECEKAVGVAFMKDFSTLVEYSLKVDERMRVANGLQTMLAEASVDVEPAVAADRLRQLLDVLKVYRVRVEPTSPAVKGIVALALRDANVARPLLERLYNERIARRELLRFNTEFRRDEAALLNALRHNPSAFEVKQVADILAVGQCWPNFRSFTPRPTVFGSFAGQSINFGSSTAQSLIFGNSAAPPPTFKYGISVAQPLNLGSSTAPPTGFSFGTPAALSTDLGSSNAPPTGINFASPAAQPTGFSFDNAAAEPTGLSRPTAQLTGFNFGNSTGPPTGISLDSSAAQPSGLGSPAAQPTSLTFGNSAAQPTGFSFGSSAAQLTNWGTSTAPPTGFSFGNSAAQPMDLGSPITQKPAPGSFSDQPTVCSSSTVLDSFAATPTIFGDSASSPKAISCSAASPIAFSRFADQPTLFGSSATQQMGFGSASVQPMGFRRAPPPSHRYRHFSRFAARQPSFNMFTSKLVVYFDQKQDFTTHLRTALKERIAQGQYVKLARPLASLFGNNFEKELRDADVAGKERVKFAAALRACAHRARPVVNLAEWGWRKAGIKAVATRAMRCRKIERSGLTCALAGERRTVRVALALSMRFASSLLLDTFESAAKLRPVVALRVALQYFRRHGDCSDLRVWDIIKPLLSSVDLEPRESLRRILVNIDWIPSTIKPDYCITLYIALHKISTYNSQILRHLSKLLPDCDEFIENILLQMLNDDYADKDISAISYPTIFVRYLLLSRNEEDAEKRFEKIGNRFLERLDTLRCKNDYNFQRRLHQILESLKYNSAFLDSKFSSCLSVIERILAWLQKFMPKEKYFKTNTQVHLTMLYFKAIRQSMKQTPEVFADPNRRKSEGVEAVGFVFGKYIVKEVAELVSTYFDSITELYTDALVDYLYSNLAYGSSRNKFIGVALKGILTEAVGIQRRMAVYVLREHHIGLEDSVRKEIEKLIMKDQAIGIFAHDGLFDRAVPVMPYYNNFQIRNN